MHCIFDHSKHEPFHSRKVRLYYLQQLCGAHEPSHTKTSLLSVKSMIFVKNREPLINPKSPKSPIEKSNIIGGPGFEILRFFLPTPGWDKCLFLILQGVRVLQMKNENERAFFFKKGLIGPRPSVNRRGSRAAQ